MGGWIERGGQELVESGVPPELFGWRWVRHVDAARAADHPRNRLEIHPRAVTTAPLPRNIGHRDELPTERGWWGFSFHDVPERRSSATAVLTFEDVRVLSARQPAGKRDYYPAILTARGQSLDLREIRHRPLHAGMARARPRRNFASGIWIAERVYHNHAHWLTAHLTKIVLLRDLEKLDELVLPAELDGTLHQSLRLLGLDPAAFPRVRTGDVVAFERLGVIACDRFRPELLDRLRTVLARPGKRHRRLFVTRRRARGRRLLEEDTLHPVLRAHGFELIEMEALGFLEQVELMGEATVLAGPHGAGLTNMLFCAPGTQVVEIADRGYPSPNFYALASALGHDYWWVGATSAGTGRAPDQDLRVDPEALRRVLEALPA